MRKGKNENQLLRKLCCTAIILAIYVLGRRIPLYGIDVAWYKQAEQGAEHFLGMAVGGDAYKTSVLALGISPYMIASIVMMAITGIRRAATRSKFSLKRMNRAVYAITLIIACCQAVFMASGMQFLSGVQPVLARVIVAAELAGGAMLILGLSELNKEHGIGGQSVLIMVNLLGSIAAMLPGYGLQKLAVPVGCALIAAAATLAMENAELRMPVQRVFIHNVYKDKNYLAIKFNPIGVMPVMFSTAIFVLLQQLLVAARYLLRDVVALGGLVDAMVLTRPAGIAVYIAIIYLFTVAFSLILISPSDIAEQLLKNNDSICNVCSGKPTKAHLTRAIVCVSLLSATVMSVCVGGALLLQLYGNVDAGLVMLPSVAMMLTSILANLYRELKTEFSFGAYRIFL